MIINTLVPTDVTAFDVGSRVTSAVTSEGASEGASEVTSGAALKVALEAAWYQPWKDLIKEVGTPDADLRGDWIERLNRAAASRGVCNARGLSIRFDADSSVSKSKANAIAYEMGIADSGIVPTRTGGAVAWHDYFNALVWLVFPRTKAVINQRQSQAIAADGVTGQRGSLRDALTLFDESAVLFVSPDVSQHEDLRQFKWTRLFVERRSEFVASTRCVVFGHALLHKLLTPYKAICGQCLVFNGTLLDQSVRPPVNDAIVRSTCLETMTIAQLDGKLAASIAHSDFGKPAMTPLPVLGVPAWWAANEQAEFYNDPSVFRRQRK